MTMARDEIAEAAGMAAHGDDGIATPTLISPPESKTPPTATATRNQAAFPTSTYDGTSEPVDASALQRALEQYDQGGRMRERTPGASPSRKRPRIYGDR
jgi:cell division cycle 20-like protein 1 (cofactor of APC complex)